MKMLKGNTLLCLLLSTIIGSDKVITQAFTPVHNTFSIHKTNPNRYFSTTKPTYSSSSISHLSAVATTPLAEGLLKTITKEGTGPSLVFGDVATVSYQCYYLDDNTTTLVPFAQSTKQKIVVGDNVMIPGWEKALASMKVGEKATIRINDANTFGYGVAGVPPIIPSNAILELNIQVLEMEKQSSLSASGFVSGSGELSNLDPSKPRTPEAIAAAYKLRQEQMAIEKANEKEGLEGFLEKAKDFYFFGFFEGETGQQAPWFLRPSITFPIAFVIVGLGFYITLAAGGIKERGAQITDELDDIVLSSVGVKDAIVNAFLN